MIYRKTIKEILTASTSHLRKQLLKRGIVILSEPAKPIEAGKPAPMPLPPPAEAEQPPISPTVIERFAKKMGFEKKPVELTQDQKEIRTSIVIFLVLSVLLFIRWIKPFVIGNTFTGTWEDFVEFLEIIAIIFIQVVVSKIKTAYALVKEWINKK